MSSMSTLGPTYYKFRHLTRDSFPDLTPDDAFELIGAKEELETELERGCPNSSVNIGRDSGLYHLVIASGNYIETDDNFYGWKVLCKENDC